MARPVRFQHPGAIDHVMVRGDGGETVFETDDDRKSFVFRLVQVCESHGWRMLSAKGWQKHSTNHEKTRACESARPDPIHVHEWQFNYGQKNYVQRVGEQVEEEEEEEEEEEP